VSEAQNLHFSDRLLGNGDIVLDECRALNGVLFLIAGAAEISIGMHSRIWGRFFLWVIGGLVYLAAGVLCIPLRRLCSARG